MTTPLRLVSMDCSIDLASSYAESGVAEILNQLDQDLIGARIWNINLEQGALDGVVLMNT